MHRRTDAGCAPARAQTRPRELACTLSLRPQERKELIGQKLNEKHNNWGSLLLGLGMLIAVEGPVNTWLRTGKLFPGPHLFAGAGIAVLWAAAAALVPQMQKGNETARSLHIAFNTINILLFAWQIPTGLEIVEKVRRCEGHTPQCHRHAQCARPL